MAEPQLKLHIRPETAGDAVQTREVNEQAFGRPAEADIVERVRQSPGFVPQLSLVAEHAGRIVGHVLFSEVTIEGQPQPVQLLALGPIAVRPDLQRRGIGGQLIHAGIRRARELGYRAIALIGHPSYYPRFGFLPGSRFGLSCSIPVPDEVFMVLPLYDDALAGVTGRLVYPPAFGA